uniref:ATP-binding protein n=1 Tax=Streptomyces sp. NBC_00119 TaxID=2975659 RepID=A0AAU1UMH9_9ACTN
MTTDTLATLREAAGVEIAPSPADRAPQEIATPVQETAPDWGLALGISAAGFAARSFRASPASLRQVRRFTRQVVCEWGLANYADDATAVVSELAANAIQHALNEHGSVWLGLVRSNRGLVCVMADPSAAPPASQTHSLSAENDRGLDIVDALTTHWGYTDADRPGKAIWARIPIPAR